MSDFDKEMQHLLTEYFTVEQSINDNQGQIKMLQEEIAIASKYIGEIKGQMIENMRSLGVVNTKIKRHTITRKKNPLSIKVINDAELDDKYFRIKKEADKTSLRNDIKKGIKVSGVELIKDQETIQIRSN